MKNVFFVFAVLITVTACSCQKEPLFEQPNCEVTIKCHSVKWSTVTCPAPGKTDEFTITGYKEEYEHYMSACDTSIWLARMATKRVTVLQHYKEEGTPEQFEFHSSHPVEACCSCEGF